MNNPENASILIDHYRDLYFREITKTEELIIQNNELKNKIDRLMLIVRGIIYEGALDLSNKGEMVLYKKIIDIIDS